MKKLIPALLALAFIAPAAWAAGYSNNECVIPTPRQLVSKYESSAMGPASAFAASLGLPCYRSGYGASRGQSGMIMFSNETDKTKAAEDWLMVTVIKAGVNKMTVRELFEKKAPFVNGNGGRYQFLTHEESSFGCATYSTFTRASIPPERQAEIPADARDYVVECAFRTTEKEILHFVRRVRHPISEAEITTFVTGMETYLNNLLANQSAQSMGGKVRVWDGPGELPTNLR